jgi:hypothetical protein
MHALQAFKFCQDTIARVTDEQLGAAPAHAVPTDLLDRYNAVHRKAREVVYYAAIDGLIKIGTTVHLDQRVKTLGANLLATEPGGYDLERARHGQFAHLLSRAREYFHPGPDLLEHVVALQRAAAPASMD